MWRNAARLVFGMAIGLIASVLLPGHQSVQLTAAFLLSMVGSAAGLVGSWLLPSDTPQPGHLACSGLGALAMLLLYGIFR